MALLLNASDSVNRSYTITKPSPTHPLDVNGTGENTGNLFDGTEYPKTSMSNVGVWVYAADLTGSVYRIPCKPNTTYTLYLTENINITIWRIRDISTDDVPTAQTTTVQIAQSHAESVPSNKSTTFTTSQNAKYILFQSNANAYSSILSCIMLVEGSTPLPYEPYGFKIPISSAGQTTPVYLGEVETTRRVKKLVLTGTENFKTENNIFAMPFTGIVSGYYQSFCNVYSHQSSYAGVVNTNNTFAISNTRLLMHDSRYTSADDFKAYLAAQYATGTPVCVWYVLATPETAVINEPIRKIGDYADEVSGISIPTIAGANTLSVGTTLQPSEASVNYKGWHPVQSAHERENGAWT